MKNRTRWKRVYPNIIGKRFFDEGEYGLGFFTVLKAWKCKKYSKSAYALNGTQWFDEYMILIKTNAGIKYKIPFCSWLNVYDRNGIKWSKLFNENPW